jgi:hypothetical protein
MKYDAEENDWILETVLPRNFRGGVGQSGAGIFLE